MLKFSAGFLKQFNISDILNHFEITLFLFFSLPQFNIIYLVIVVSFEHIGSLLHCSNN
jgi:hypothetical protein